MQPSTAPCISPLHLACRPRPRVCGPGRHAVVQHSAGPASPRRLCPRALSPAGRPPSHASPVLVCGVLPPGGACLGRRPRRAPRAALLPGDATAPHTVSVGLLSLQSTAAGPAVRLAGLCELVIHGMRIHFCSQSHLQVLWEDLAEAAHGAALTHSRDFRSLSWALPRCAHE